MDPNLVISLFVAVGVAMIFWGMDLLISARRVGLAERIGDFAPSPSAASGKEDGKSKRAGSSLSGNWGRQLATDLARADLPIKPSEYVAIMFMMMVLGFLLCYAVFKSPLLGLVGSILGWLGPRLYVLFLQHRRIEAFNGQLESMLVLLANTLRAGYGLGQGFETVAKELSPPLSTEFSRLVREISLGIPTNEALANLLRRNPSRDLDLVITAMNVNREVGGNLSEVLDRSGATIRERVRLQGEIRSITAMQRASAVVLVLLPVGLGLVIYIVNAEYVSLLWTNTCGFVMLGAWFIMMTLGILTIRRLLAFRY